MTDAHDPIRFITDLRDHLARHDKPIAFLFGAGTSCAVGKKSVEGDSEFRPLIPAIIPLTRLCKDSIAGQSTAFMEAWDALEQECPTGHGHPNVEDILSRVRMKREAMGSDDKLCGLDKEGTFARTVRGKSCSLQHFYTTSASRT